MIVAKRVERRDDPERLPLLRFLVMLVAAAWGSGRPVSSPSGSNDVTIPSGLPLLRFLVMLVAAWGLGGLLVAMRFFRREPRAT